MLNPHAASFLRRALFCGVLAFAACDPGESVRPTASGRLAPGVYESTDTTYTEPIGQVIQHRRLQLNADSTYFMETKYTCAWFKVKDMPRFWERGRLLVSGNVLAKHQVLQRNADVLYPGAYVWDSTYGEPQTLSMVDSLSFETYNILEGRLRWKRIDEANRAFPPGRVYTDPQYGYTLEFPLSWEVRTNFGSGILHRNLLANGMPPNSSARAEVSEFSDGRRMDVTLDSMSRNFVRELGVSSYTVLSRRVYNRRGRDISEIVATQEHIPGTVIRSKFVSFYTQTEVLTIKFEDYNSTYGPGSELSSIDSSLTFF